MRKKMIKLSIAVCVLIAMSLMLVACVPDADSGTIKPPDGVGSDSGFIYEEIIANNIGAAVCIKAGSSSGSGFLISSNGYIVTNYHVVEKASGTATVSILDENGINQTYTAKMLAKIDTKVDIAVLKIDSKEMINKTFKGLQFAKSSTVNFGTPCVMMGNPKGLGLITTRAMISNPSVSVVNNGRTYNYMVVDTPVNPGNSGGALVDRTGKVIGVITARQNGLGSNNGDIVLDIGYAQRADNVVEYLKRYTELSALFAA